MPSETQQDEPVTKTGKPASAETRVRLWPVVLLLCAHGVTAFAFWSWGSTNVHSAIAFGVVPSAVALLLIMWWLVASRAPWRYRLSGIGLIAAVFAVVVLSQKSTDFGFMLLAYALPSITTGVMILLVATFIVNWRIRSTLLALYILGCAGFFAAMRVDSIGGDLVPVVSWRWRPTAQELSEALEFVEVRGRAELPLQAGPGDWPGFRGPERDGRLGGVQFSTDWSVTPRAVWRREIGPAWSSFAVVGNYLFTQEQRGPYELVSCYHADTGAAVWLSRIEACYEDAMGLGPRATPTFDSGMLYALGGTGILQCLDAATGETVWQRDIGADAQTKVPGWGFVSSPLVIGETVVQFAGGASENSLLAYNRHTGDIEWRAGHGASGYSSPHFARIADVPQILMASNWGIQGFMPETGELLWEYHSAVPNYPRCTQPLMLEARSGIFALTSTMGSTLLEVQRDTAWRVDARWDSRRFRPYFKDGFAHNGYLYGFDGNRFVCVDADTGERQWAGQRYGGQALLLSEMDVVLILSEAGEVVLVEATPHRFHERARFNALSGKTWNHPVIAHGRLYIRNAEEAACYELPVP